VSAGRSPRRGRARARVAVACATLLVLLLPALTAARRLAEPARPDELARLARADARDASGLETGPMRAFFARAGAFAPLPDGDAERQRAVVRARLWQVATILATTFALYTAVVSARGRLHALLACIALALLPAVAGAGHVLRPEGPATALSAFAVLLLVGVAAPTRRHGGSWRGPWSPTAVRWGLAVCAVCAIGFAVAMLPAHAAVLLAPGAVLFVAAAQIALRAVRIVRRGGWLRLPVRAINQRLLPWTCMALAAPAAALAMLSQALRGPADAVAATTGAGGVLPTGAGGVVVGVLAAVGALVAVVQVGGSLRRGGHITGALVLFAAAAVAFAARVQVPADRDALPLAPAIAVLTAEGVYALLAIGWRALGERRRPLTSP
jgi:hypothetical protein